MPLYNVYGEKKKKNKGPSDMSTTAKLALAAHTAIITGSIGFGDVIHNAMKLPVKISQEEEQDLAMKYVDENIIGRDLVYKGPYGCRKVVYCDYTASGKAIRFIEDYIRDEVLPYYGNTHTTTSVSSLQTTVLRTEAKNIIRKSTNANDLDAVIFVSSGCTGAIAKLIHSLNFKKDNPPVVFISPFEHHSNLLPWLELGAEVVYGAEAKSGTLDLVVLESDLRRYSTQNRPMVGSFAAASNITGILTDTKAVATLCHQYQCYAFFDYATAGPYVQIDMNPVNEDGTPDELAYKDAFFCSTHKFVGGPGTPGLLIAKKSVFINPVPSGAGGGTVLFVTHKKHQYITDIEEREEGGTPAIVESIRAGLVFQLKEEVSTKNIMRQEHRWVEIAYKRWDSIPNLYVLGKSTAERIPIFALVITHPKSKMMIHHNFISALLNDLFGIQARGGCACAGPYAEDLLGMSEEVASKLTDIITGNLTTWEDIPASEVERLKGFKYNILKPGFARLNLPYFFDIATINYIVDAVAFVAEHAWKLMPLYSMTPATGDFDHKEFDKMEDRTHLTDINFQLKGNSLKADYPKKDTTIAPATYEEAMVAADELIKKATKKLVKMPLLDNDEFLPKSLVSTMRWFMLPSEAHSFVKGHELDNCLNFSPMFFPRRGAVAKGKMTRSRIKSGLGSIRNCNCKMHAKKHRKNDSCHQEKLDKIAEQ